MEVGVHCADLLKLTCVLIKYLIIETKTYSAETLGKMQLGNSKIYIRQPQKKAAYLTNPSIAQAQEGNHN